MNIVKRAQAPTPKFFQVLRNIGLTLASVSGVILTAPIGLPVAIVQVAGYLAVAAGVVSAVSQITVDTPTEQPKVSVNKKKVTNSSDE